MGCQVNYTQSFTENQNVSATENQESHTSFISMEQHVIYNPEYRVLICREHACGITPRGVELHFRVKHNSLPLETRQAILKYSRTLLLCEPENIKVLEVPIDHINGLEIVDGYHCNATNCTTLFGTFKSIQRHCCDHDCGEFMDVEKRYRHVKLQTFFKGGLLRYAKLMGSAFQNNYYLILLVEQNDRIRNIDGLSMRSETSHH
jgi:hypothetical protein